MADFTEIQQRLLAQNRLDLFGKVGEDMGLYVRKALMWKSVDGAPDLTIHISSNGGSVSWGLDIYDALMFYPGKKRAVVHGMAASMAAVLLQACEDRYATPHAKVLIHHISSSNISLDTLRKKESLAKFQRDMESDQERIYAILAGRSKQTRDEIMKKCEIDVPMSADEALKFGLIDRIIAKISDLEEKK